MAEKVLENALIPKKSRILSNNYNYDKKIYFCASSNLTLNFMIKTDTPVSFFRFEDLRIYAKALDYITWLHHVVDKFPGHNQPTLAQPFLKVSQSIALFLAEGSARNKPQFIYYLKMAKSSVRECVVYTEIAYRLGLINEESKEFSVTQMMELTKMIGSLVTSLQRTIPNAKEEDEYDDMQLPPDLD